MHTTRVEQVFIPRRRKAKLRAKDDATAAALFRTGRLLVICLASMEGFTYGGDFPIIGKAHC